MSRPLVVGLGELVWDLLPIAEPPAERRRISPSMLPNLAGRPPSSVRWGRITQATQLLDWIKTAGVDPAHIQRTDRSTGTVSVSLSESGQPQYQIHPDVAWDHLAWTPSLANLAKQVDCVCVGSLGQRSPRLPKNHPAISSSNLTSSPSDLRCNLRDPHHDPSVIAETVGLANILKLNQDEWSFVARQFSVSTDWSVGLKQLIDATQLRLIAMTRGAHGSVLVDKDGMHQLEAEPIEIADTVGAGDAFTAAMAMGLLRNNPIATIQQTAATAASFVCTQSGATPSLPSSIRKPQRSTPTGLLTAAN